MVWVFGRYDMFIRAFLRCWLARKGEVKCCRWGVQLDGRAKCCCVEVVIMYLL